MLAVDLTLSWLSRFRSATLEGSGEAGRLGGFRGPLEETSGRAWAEPGRPPAESLRGAGLPRLEKIFHNYATAARSKSYLNTLGTLELSTLVTGLLPRLRTEGDPALCVEAPADSSEPADSQALPTEPRPREPPREPLRLFL